VGGIIPNGGSLAKADSQALRQRQSMKPVNYLESVKDRLGSDSFLSGFRIIREYSNPETAHIRARIIISNGSYLEFYEYIEQVGKGELQIKTYSYHWADKDNRLIRRWDNTKHFPKLKNFPHHIHDGETGEVTSGKPINIFEVLDEIAASCCLNGEGS